VGAVAAGDGTREGSGPRGGGAAVIDWSLAEKVARWTATRKPVLEGYRASEVQADFDELTAQAEELVASSTGLRADAGPARARVADRAA